MRVKFHPEARVDLKKGRAFYRSRSPLAALAFSHEIDATVSRISESPLRYQYGDHGTRELAAAAAATAPRALQAR
jgi:ParE toxin of type II toxin-antitoxin system, parDE